MMISQLFSSWGTLSLHLLCVRERYCTLFNFGKVLFTVGSLCTGLISAWFSLAGSRHSLNFPFSFGSNMKLIHHLAVLSMPSGVMMSCCYICSSSSLNGCCRANAMHPGDSWYDWLSGLTCNENVPSKQLIPLNTSLNSICNHCVISSLAFLSVSLLGLEGNAECYCYYYH